MEMTNPKKRSERHQVRLVIRRTRLLGSQAQLFPDWRYHAFVTNLDLPAVETDRHHQPRAGEDTEPLTTDTGQHPDGNEDREPSAVETDRYHQPHATCELAIRDLKHSEGLAHLPSASFAANAAWLICAALSHNIYRQIALLGRTQPKGRLVCGRTIRNRIFGIPRRVVNHRGLRILRLPARWPWEQVHLTTLANLRRLPQVC